MFSSTSSAAKLTRLEAAYTGAIDGALARRDYVTAAQLGDDFDKRMARLTSTGSLRRLGPRAAAPSRA